MKKISIQTDYRAKWGQILHIIGSIPELGNWDNQSMASLKCENSTIWQISLEVPHNIMQVEFKLLLMEDGKVVREEYGNPHSIILHDQDTIIKCIWQEKPSQEYFLRSMFKNSVFKHHDIAPKISTNQSQLVVTCLHIEQTQELVILGEDLILGQWNTDKGISLQPIDYGKWHISFDDNSICKNKYKLAIRDKASKKIIEWEEGENRCLNFNRNSLIEEIYYRKSWIDWKASGVSIPIFSLRSEKSFGIGEFSDLNLLIDWANNAKLKVIQVLPINDTTATYTWIDSYPYNSISIYALHPIYLGLHEFSLKDKAKDKKYKLQGQKLNELGVVDYTEVIKLKTEYIKELHDEIGEVTLNTKSYKEFYIKNKEWLVPYACFCYLRDKYKTAQISDWGEFKTYDKEKFADLAVTNTIITEAVNRVYFTQYLLHKQLTAAKEYAYTKGIVLKGDIPIGISPNSVEAWTEPHLFNLDTQTGAPPDDFSVNGQNWGFPTYNWNEMQKDNYKWWTKRFVKMADYFDAYRIDHILGFFRIWEIPKTSIHGLLGYFSPALPLSKEEIYAWGFPFDEQMTFPGVHKDDLLTLFGEYWQEVRDTYLTSNDEQWYILNDDCDNQRKVKNLFLKRESQKDIIIRDGLYAICNEVLFIRDRGERDRLHPRISLQQTFRYSQLDNSAKKVLDSLYENYFYHRHSQFWRDQAMSKLPTLVNATNMLVCGEDLGMVPESVPSVMNELKILSLEIQRMPKQLGTTFSDLQQLPYLSVTTTSTHDMSPIRLLWKENNERTEYYYKSILNLDGTVPKDCNTAICLLIIRDHLNSPAMLAILPLQDWLSVSDKLKRKNPEEEQINEPSNPLHNWNYRMHITLEELIENKDFSDLIRFLNEESKR